MTIVLIVFWLLGMRMCEAWVSHTDEPGEKNPQWVEFHWLAKLFVCAIWPICIVFLINCDVKDWFTRKR